MEAKETLPALVPAPPDWRIPWEALEETRLSPFFADMAKTPQDPLYHGEGDVWAHTRLVCEALAAIEGFRGLEEGKRQAVFLAALLHDVGKIRCTKRIDGRWTSPRHAAAGAGMAREALWLDFDWCGQPDWQRLRETVCGLIRYHGLPVHAALEAEGERRLLRAASNGALLPDFSVELLCLLAEADAKGKRCGDQEELLEAVALCRALAEELGCLERPRVFPSAHTAYAYFSGQGALPAYERFDDTWGEILLLSGLPGTGKDTWIAAHCPELPVVSLDGIRREKGISPTGPQGQVAEEARARARALLRQRQPFVWNATNVTPDLRQRIVSLCAGYHARVRLVYLETGWEEELRRNRGREAAVPEAAIGRMLGRLIPPEAFEAHRVEWQCV